MRTGPRLLRSRSLVLIYRLRELYLCSRKVQNIPECWRARNIRESYCLKCMTSFAKT